MKRELDRSLLLTILFLLGLGLVQVYSSSFIFAIESFDDGLFFVKKQALFIALAVGVTFITAYLPWKWVYRAGILLWAVAFVGVVLTHVPGLGVRVGGAVRWLNLGGGFRVEPSEILKYTYPAFLAFVLPQVAKRGMTIRSGLLVLMAVAPLGFLLAQPDFGSVAILSAVMFALLFARGLKWRYVVAGISALGVAGYFLIVKVDYRMARVTAFLDPWSDPAQKGFQVIQSMLGFYSGGVTGVGLGQGQGKLFFLPEAHTDFTLSVLGEEWGFLGMLITLTLFGYVALRGLQIAVKSEDETKQIAGLGVTLIFTITAMVNSGVAMGVLPTKGLGMPFLSYGGSALLSTCFGLGMLLNIDRSNRESKVKSFIKINS
ncbi:MAG: cell division protein FtsW [Bdellovibrionales bacterium]|nr:cell division protein FtsW [Bdellovibrionales bacterium]